MVNFFELNFYVKKSFGVLIAVEIHFLMTYFIIKSKTNLWNNLIKNSTPFLDIESN